MAVLEDGLCYLCGQKLNANSNENNLDHVPMRQLWTPEIRKSHNLNLVTLKVHQSCNREYQEDEDYFLATILPFSKGSYSGETHYRKLTSDIKANKNIGLKLQVLGEFSNRIGNILLPNGKVAKSFDTNRFNRIIWKIVRGLFFKHNNGVVLPLNWPIVRDLFIDSPPPHFRMFNSLPDIAEHGDYPCVFSYRYTKHIELNGLHYWAMLFLDRIIVTVCFHDPLCRCEECLGAKF